MKYFIVFVVFFLLNCKDIETEKRSAEMIVNTALEISGAEKVASSGIDFHFRDRHYYAKRHKGNFLLKRVTIDANHDSVVDVLSNDGFKQYINDKENVFLEDSIKAKYAASVNSVHYFSVLPYGLNDKAVIKSRLKDASIKDKMYHTIEVTFKQEGGGEDFEDVFLYWINIDTFKVEYLAYSYAEADGFGVRFRDAYNERYVNGIRFVDYNNYKPQDAIVALSELPRLFETGQLELLSKIELEDITVN
jgi:hypothetical protein